MKTQGIITVMMTSDSPRDWSPFLHNQEPLPNDDQNQADPDQQEIRPRHIQIKHKIQQEWHWISSILLQRVKTAEIANNAHK